MNELIALIIMGIGVLFQIFGCIGLVRLPDVYNRIEGGTKCATLGTSLILLGVLVYFGFTSIGVKALLAAIFISLTAPTAAHAIARASHLAGVKPWTGTVVDRFSEEIQHEEKKGDQDA